MIIGAHRNGKDFIRKFKFLRRLGKVNKFVSISEKNNNTYIACDDGRLCRPLIVVEKQLPLI